MFFILGGNCHLRGEEHSYLVVLVEVYFSTCVMDEVSECGYVTVGTWEEEQFD